MNRLQVTPKTLFRCWNAVDRHGVMFWTALAVILLISLLPAEAAMAVEDIIGAVEPAITEKDLVDEAARNNPEIQAARERVRAAEEIYRIDTGYPDPQLTVTYYPAPIETRLGPQDWNASLSQAIPYPGKLARAGEVAETRADLSALALEKVARDVALAVRESYHELFYIQEAKEILGRQTELFDNLINATESAYAQDRVGLVAVINAHSHMDELERDRLLLEAMAQSETATLNSLLNRDPDAPLGLLKTPGRSADFVNLEELYRLAEMNQEDIQMAAARIRQGDAELDLARYQSRPDFKVGLFYAAIGSPDVSMRPADAGDDAVGIQFSVSLPLWGEKNSGRVEKANAERSAAAADKLSAANRVRARIRVLYANLERSRDTIALYEEKLLPQARTAVDATESWFLAKQPNFSDFVEAQSLWYRFQLALARARADYGKDLARLERIVNGGEQ